MTICCLNILLRNIAIHLSSLEVRVAKNGGYILHMCAPIDHIGGKRTSKTVRVYILHAGPFAYHLQSSLNASLGKPVIRGI